MGDGAERFQQAVAKVQTLNMVTAEAEVDDSPTIKVCVRVRPFIREEVEGERSGGKTECCIAMPTTTTTEMLGREEIKRFEFDRCYWSHSEDHPLFANQQTLQDELGQSMLNSALNGFNNCIFAYGQTGSGKSFSVLGGKGDARGLLPRVVEGLFEHFGRLDEEVATKTEVSFIEIYNEQIRDLFAVREEGATETKKLEVKQHAILGTIIPGLTEAPVKTCEEVLKLVEYGTQMRHVAETAMNATSSRSHCIFTFKTSVSEREGQAKMSRTHLVDLAGSERAGRTKAKGNRLKEGAAINQSLSTLATVIRELAKQSQKKKSNPPFRDSKLTYILKESLCGNSKTVMMAAISPSLSDYDETLSTMNFAKSVKQVQTKAVVNQVNERGVEDALRQELEELRAKLAALQAEAQGLAPEPGGPDQPSQQMGQMSQMSRPTLARSAYVQRRLKEQEQLSRWFGKDWEDILAEEKKKQQKRAAILDEQPLSAVQALRAKHEQQEREQQGASNRSAGGFASKAEEREDEVEQATTRSDGTAPVTEVSDSEDSATDTERRLQCVLVQLRRPEALLEDPGTRNSRNTVRLGMPSSIAVLGPRAASCGATAADVEAKSEQLQRVRAAAARAEEAANALSAKGARRLRVRVLIGVEPGEAGDPLSAEVLIHSSLTDDSVNDASAGPGGSDGHGEWLEEEVLLQRLRWLQVALDEGSFDPAAHDGGAWAAATEALASGGAPHPEPELEDPGEDPNAVAARSAAAEANRLNEELHVVQDELSRMKSKLKAEKHAAKELREELVATQSELAKAKAKLKGQHGGVEDEELKSLRAELEAAREELGKRPALPEIPPRAAAPFAGHSSIGKVAQEVAQSFDHAINAIDSAQAELERTKHRFNWG